MGINWEVVIDFNSSPGAIKIKLYDIFSFRVINWIGIVVLRKDIVGEKANPVLMLELVMCCHC